MTDITFGPHLLFEPAINDQREIPLSPGQNIVGRSEPADIVLPFQQISRRHATIEYADFACFVADLGSTNGTFVNGEQVGADPVRVDSGAEIVFGGAIMAHFTDPSATPKVQRLGRLKGIWIDEKTKAVWIDALPVQPPLSASQLKLLQILYDANGKIVPRDEIVANVWSEYDPETVTGEAVDGLIKRLRQRMRQAQPEHEYIQVIRGYGLRIVLPE